MSLLWLAFVAVVLAFGFVLLFGPPYLPTRKKHIQAALDLLALEPGQTMLELGCGDGRVLLAAAQRGWRVVGIELNPLLVLVARLATWRYRNQVRILWGDYFRVRWPEAQGIFTFMIPRQMAKLDGHIRAHVLRPVRLVSFAFAIPGKKSARQRDGVFLYDYR
ncbi:MAG: SAM-dependent methyltransferase [Candidatus Saccharimonadales bacterium]